MGSGFLDCLNKWAPSEDGGLGFRLLRIKPGSYSVRILDAVPTKRDVHFESIPDERVICPQEGCLFCARNDKKTRMYYVNVLDRKDNTIKVLAFTKGVVDPLREVLAASEDPRGFDISIVRTGTSREDTRYEVSKIDRSPAVDVDNLKLYNIEKLLQPMDPDMMATKLNYRSVSKQRSTKKIRDLNAESDSTDNEVQNVLKGSDLEAPL